MNQPTPKYRVFGFALIEPQMNVVMDMLKYARDVYAQGSEPLPDMLKLMDNTMAELDKQVKNQPDFSKQEKGLINE